MGRRSRRGRGLRPRLEPDPRPPRARPSADGSAHNERRGSLDPRIELRNVEERSESRPAAGGRDAGDRDRSREVHRALGPRGRRRRRDRGRTAPRPLRRGREHERPPRRGFPLVRDRLRLRAAGRIEIGGDPADARRRGGGRRRLRPAGRPDPRARAGGRRIPRVRALRRSAPSRALGAGGRARLDERLRSRRDPDRPDAERGSPVDRGGRRLQDPPVRPRRIDRARTGRSRTRRAGRDLRRGGRRPRPRAPGCTPRDRPGGQEPARTGWIRPPLRRGPDPRFDQAESTRLAAGWRALRRAGSSGDGAFASRSSPAAKACVDIARSARP